jgi:hypothetical protein
MARGTVVDAARGTGVSGAEVAMNFPESRMYSTSTDAEGRFELGPVPRLDGELVVSHPRYQPGKAPFRPSQNAPLTVRLEAASSVKGQVLTRSGEVPAGLYARASNSAGGVSAWVTDGAFEIGPLEAGSWAVELSSEDRAADLSAFDILRVELPAGESREVEFLERAGGTSFEVEVVDSSGVAASPGVVLVRGKPVASDALAEALRLTGLTGSLIDRGVYRFRAVPPGDWTLVSNDGEATQAAVLVGPQLAPRIRFVVPASR